MYDVVLKKSKERWDSLVSTQPLKVGNKLLWQLKIDLLNQFESYVKSYN